MLRADYCLTARDRRGVAKKTKLRAKQASAVALIAGSTKTTSDNIYSRMIA